MGRDGGEILLIEDDPQHVELMLRAFKRSQVADRIHLARDGIEALDFILARGPYEGRAAARRLALVILDLKLPRISGLEVLARLRSLESLRAIPVVVLTSSHEERDMRESYRLGANSFVTKPLSFEPLAGALSQIATYWLSVNQLP